MDRRALLAVAALALTAAACSSTPSVSSPQTAVAQVDHHVATLGRGSLDAATLDVTSGANTLDITTGDLGSRLVRATTPQPAGQVPALTPLANGITNLQLGSAGSAGGGPSIVSVVLARSVSWTVELDGGATVERVDLRGARAALVDLGAGVTHATVMLSARSGTQRVRETGGASELTVDVPRSVATLAQVFGGASTVAIDGTTHSGVAGGSVFSAPGYAGAADRLDLELHGGVSALTVQATPT